jgi:hypothetical protein
MARDDTQLNVRLEKDRRAVLDAAAFVRGISARKLLEELAEEAIKRFREESSVRMALAAQREHLAAAQGKLTHLQRARTATDERQGHG